MLRNRPSPVFLVAIGHMVVELSSQFLPVVYPLVKETMGLNYTQVGLLALVASLGTSVAQPLFGYLSDRWDPRWITALSVAWIGTVMGLVGLAGSYAVLALTIGLGVLGSAAYHPPGATIASSAVKGRRGVSVSIFSVGGSAGSALSPLLITAGIGWLGMRGTVVLIPVAILYGLVLFALLRRTGRPPQQHTSATRRAPPRNVLAGLSLVVLAVMCLAWFQGSLRTYLPIWVEQQSGSLSAGGRLMFTLMATMGVGSLIGGALSDRIGRWQMLVIALALLAPVSWLFVSASGAAQWVLVVVIGMLLGTTFPASIVMAQETWPSGMGIASGLVMGLGWLPAGIGASVTGAIADRVSLEAGLRTLLIPALIGAGLVTIYGVMQGKRAAEQEEPLSA
ncbi:MAG TPA: MFS transporter [Anaerolineae bacterium]|nr:MFS transporter [Anaerolineae bacterium]